MQDYGDKNIVVGLTGGIACYKAVEIVSKLTQQGANVQVIMTKAACEFVTPLTLRSVSKNQVFTDMFGVVENWNVKHVSLAEQADLLVIAPATANIIGKIANGIADDLLTTTVMASTAPVLIAPAMNVHMYNNPIVQNNIAKLLELGYHFAEPEEGYLACGTVGKGRLTAITNILDRIAHLLKGTEELRGLNFLVTAGGTKEPIDPVRYIGNHSSGKMGYAICEALLARGAEVTLISGPTSLPVPKGAKYISVTTAHQMYQACRQEYSKAQVIIKAAAVADYRPIQSANQKLKKADSEKLVIELEKNPDILAYLGQNKQEKQLLIGFAAETEELLANAVDKMHRKNLDLIVANDVTIPNSGFNAAKNQVSFIQRDGCVENYPLLNKRIVAEKLIEKILKLLHKE